MCLIRFDLVLSNIYPDNCKIFFRKKKNCIVKEELILCPSALFSLWFACAYITICVWCAWVIYICLCLFRSTQAHGYTDEQNSTKFEIRNWENIFPPQPNFTFPGQNNKIMKLERRKQSKTLKMSNNLKISFIFRKLFANK